MKPRWMRGDALAAFEAQLSHRAVARESRSGVTPGHWNPSPKAANRYTVTAR